MVNVLPPAACVAVQQVVRHGAALAGDTLQRSEIDSFILAHRVDALAILQTHARDVQRLPRDIADAR